MHSQPIGHALTPVSFRGRRRRLRMIRVTPLAFYSEFSPIVGFWTTLRIAHPRLLRAPATMTVRHDCLTAPLTITSSVVNWRILDAVLIAREYDLSLEDPRVIVDLGAHIGIASCWFASRYPAATVIAVEPESDNFALLAENARLYENIVPVHAAIWDRPGRVSLVDPRQGSWSYRIADTPGDIEAIPIEELLARYRIEQVDLLKVDIEGAEIELFSGDCQWLDQVNAIVVELHDRLRRGCTTAFERATAAFPLEQRRAWNVVARSRD